MIADFTAPVMRPVCFDADVRIGRALVDVSVEAEVDVDNQFAEVLTVVERATQRSIGKLPRDARRELECRAVQVAVNEWEMA